MTRRILTILAVLAVVPAVQAQETGWLQPSEIQPGLWRGRAPYFPRHFEQLKALGIETILDMRGNQPFASARERRRAERHGMTYWNVPISFHPLKDGSGDPVVALMRNVSAYPMFVHCNVDRDRTSAAVGVYRIQVNGWSQEAAEAEAHSFGIRRYFIGLNRYLRSGGEP